MEQITSRKNAYIRHLRSLAGERAYRRQQGEYLCDGMKLLREAVAAGAEITSVLCRECLPAEPLPAVPVYVAPEELFRYVSPMEESPGPLFTVRMHSTEFAAPPERVIVLENLQDPGNVGTVLRTAAAMGADAVVLTGACADIYNPKAVRATMGAIFRQKVIQTDIPGLRALLEQWKLPLYGAALSETAEDIRNVVLSRSAVAVGNEGKGLSRELLDACDGCVIIPMAPGSESLNAAVAASVILWEMRRSL